jgi:hypothetical protein
MSRHDLADEQWTIIEPLIPEEDDVAPQVAQKLPQKGSHVHRSAVDRLDGNIQPHVLTLGRHREAGQRRDAVMFVAVEDVRRLSLRRPGPMTRGDEQKAARVDEREMGAKSSGFFFWNWFSDSIAPADDP